MLEYTDTICYKVDTANKELQKGISTGTFDIGMVIQLLVKIRQDAIQMENALKANKVLRLKHNIDPEFREMMKEKTTPPGINKIGAVNVNLKGKEAKPEFRVIVKDNKGETIYDNKSFAFVFCSVERIEDIDEAGMIDGTVQTLAIGHDIAIYYAFDQLRQKIQSKMADIMIKMGNSVRHGLFANRELKRKFLKMNNK